MDQIDYDMLAIGFVIDDLSRQAVKARKDGIPFVFTLMWDGKDLSTDFTYKRKEIK